MPKLDPRLRMVLEAVQAEPAAAPETVPLGPRVGLRSAPAGPQIDVLVERAGPGGIRVEQVSATGLAELADDDLVRRVEASRPMFAELNWSRQECGAAVLHEATPALRGAGVVVGVIDSGIDPTHPAFRDTDGRTRILRIWDQGADAAPGAVPFGREHTREEIDQALASADPHRALAHVDAGGHGTHVAAIAAGNELGRGEFTGIAPEADLIVVALRTRRGGTLGRSTELVQALDYIVDRAAGRPLAINISQGMNGGGHAGETLVERRIDELARRPGVVVVKSAGNEQQWDVHAGGVLDEGERRVLRVDVRADDVQDDVVEIWFGGGDDISIAVTTPSGRSSTAAAAGELVRFDTPFGNAVRIEVDEDADDTDDRRASLIFQRGVVPGLEPGRWEIALQAGSVDEGRFDAWIERAPRDAPGAPEQARFAPGSADPTRTISIPGTARRVVTVGSHVTKASDGTAIGRLSGFSSVGPARRGTPKPELTAPGEFVVSASPQHPGAHVALSGTSMAAPHVTGAAALLLQRSPRLTGSQVGQVLARTARRDARVSAGPPDGWGGGKLDAAAAAEVAPDVFAVIEAVAVLDGRVEVGTDRPTACTLRLHTSATRLAMGAAQHVVRSTAEGPRHRIDLAAVPPGRYFAEVVVVAEGWTSEDDRDGAFHEVLVEGAVGPADDRSPSVGSERDDLERIDGIGRVLAARLAGAGMTTFPDIANSTVDELARVTGRPAERILSDDWVRQAKRLAEERALSTRDRRAFTLVALIDRRTDRLVGWEATDARSGDQTTARDARTLMAFLLDKLGAADTGGQHTD